MRYLGSLILLGLMVLTTGCQWIEPIPDASEDETSSEATESTSDSDSDSVLEDAESDEEAVDSEASFELYAPEEGDSIDPNEAFTLSGQARGPWYFEAAFTVEVLDDEGNLLTQAQVTATEDWMTEGWVSFTATIEPFDTMGATHGTLNFVKANPSGMSEYEQSVSVSVQFEGMKPSAEVMWDLEANVRD